MQFASPRFVDPDHSQINTVLDGRPVHIPAEADNAHYVALLASGLTIASYAPAAGPPTADDVRREAERRMRALLGARDSAHLDIIIANGTREAVRLLRKGAATWTAEEAQRAAMLEAVDLAIEAIRAASNMLEASPPADYAADSHWPG